MEPFWPLLSRACSASRVHFCMAQLRNAPRSVLYPLLCSSSVNAVTVFVVTSVERPWMDESCGTGFLRLYRLLSFANDHVGKLLLAVLG